MTQPRLDEARPDLDRALRDPYSIGGRGSVLENRLASYALKVEAALRVERERAERQWEVTPTPDCNCGTCKALGRVRRAVLAEQEKEQP